MELNSMKSKCHPVVQVQTIDKLYKEVIKKFEAKEPIHKIKELEQIWKNITSSEDNIITNCSSQAILNLISRNTLNINETVNQLVNLAPTSHNLQFLINLLVDILIIEQNSKKSLTKKNSKSLCSSYNLHSPPHPLISILLLCPHSYASIFSKFQSLLLSNVAKDYYGVIELFKPLIWFVLGNPSEDLIHKTPTQFLVTTLLNPFFISCKDPQFRQDIIKILLQATAALPSTPDNLHLIAQFLGSTILPDLNLEIYDEVAIKLICFCNITIGSSSMLTFLHLLGKLLKEQCISVEIIKIISIALSLILCKSPPDSAQFVIFTIASLLQSRSFKTVSCHLKTICLCIFKVSMLQILLCRNLIGFNNVQPILKNAFEEINKSLKQVSNTSEFETSVLPTNAKYHVYLNSWLTFLNIAFDAIFPLFDYKTLHVFSKIDQLILVDNVGEAGNVLGLLLNSFLIFSTNHGGRNESTNVQLMVLDKLVSLNSSFPYTALTTLPSLLYSLKTEVNAEMQKNILLSLSKLAHSSDHVALILKTIQGLAHDPRLQPLVASLLLNLWKSQDRCFPYLINIFSFKSHNSSTQTRLTKELTIIQAVVVRDICKLRPHKYTSEMLPLIANIVKSNPQPSIAVLALEALFFLCEDKTVNLMTTWRELKKYFINSECTIIIKATLKLLSLTALFEIESPEYFLFKEEVLCWIWKTTVNNPIDVIGNAFVSLTHFNVQNFKVGHLPVQLQPKDLDPDLTKDVLMELPIPGSCFFNLFKATSINLKTQMQYFLTFLLREEIKNLPRDIKDRAIKSTAASPTINVASDISKFMLTMYEHNKQPNLKASYALGLLSCHNPSHEYDKDGNVLPKSVVLIGRSFIQILQTLLSEVSIDHKNWLSMTWLVVFWRHFMKRCFSALLASRKTELELQLKQSNTEDKEDIEYKITTIDMWCRDKITDILKTSSKGTPTMQGNSILALSGLVTALKSHKLEKKNQTSVPKEASAYLSYEHWKNMACDTLMCIVDSTYKSQGRIFSWCQYRTVSGLGKLTTCLLGKSCAIMSMFNVALGLLPDNTSRVKDLLNVLAKGFSSTGNAENEPNPILLPIYGISIGKVVSYIYTKKISDADNGALEHAIQVCLDLLKKCVFDNSATEELSDDEDEEVDNVGAIIGIGIILPNLVTSGNLQTQSDAKKMLTQLQELLCNSNDKSDSYHDAILKSLTWSLSSVKDFDKLFNTTKEKMLKNSNSVPLSQQFGSMCYALINKNRNSAVESYNKLFDTWIQQIADLKLPTRQRLSAISGLDYIFGAEYVLTTSPNDFRHPEKHVKKLIKVCQGLIKQKDILTKSCVTLLSRIYILSETSKREVTSKFPSTFSYLPQTSILRPSFDYLIENKNINEDFVSMIWECLSDCTSQYHNLIPPVNWSPVLSRTLSETKSEKVVSCCFAVTLSQVANDPLLSLLLSNWIQTEKFVSLPLSTQSHVYLNMDKLIRSLADTKIISFLEHVLAIVASNQNGELTNSIVSGILLGLTMHGQTQVIFAKLHSVTCEIFMQYKLDLLSEKSINNCKILANCLAECPNVDTIFPDLNDLITDPVLIKVIFVKCCLLPSGKFKLQCLNKCLKVAAKKSEATQNQVLQILKVCFGQVKISSNQNCHVIKRLEWLQEIMAIALDSSSFIFKVVSLAVLAWVKTDTKNFNSAVKKVQYEYESDFILERLLDLFPLALNQLLFHAPWNHKFAIHTIQWLIKLSKPKRQGTDKSVLDCINQTLFQLRGHTVYKQSNIWKSVVAQLYL